MASDTVEEEYVLRIVRMQVIQSIDSKALMNRVHNVFKAKYENVVEVGDSVKLQTNQGQLHYNVEPRGDFCFSNVNNRIFTRILEARTL